MCSEPQFLAYSFVVAVVVAGVVVVVIFFFFHFIFTLAALFSVQIETQFILIVLFFSIVFTFLFHISNTFLLFL